MKTLIIGAGKFGMQALRKLGALEGVTSLTMVEKRRFVCMSLQMQDINCICADGIDYLIENLNTPDDSDWIVPAIPVHVAFEWVKRKLTAKNRFRSLKVPDNIWQRLPNAIIGKDRSIYISYADFLCPPECTEPDEFCTYTGKPRPRMLFRELASIQHPGFRSIVVQSKQLAPGVGGYESQALFRALRLARDSRRPILLSTACKCHGVMHAFDTTMPE